MIADVAAPTGPQLSETLVNAVKWDVALPRDSSGSA